MAVDQAASMAELLQLKEKSIFMSKQIHLLERERRRLDEEFEHKLLEHAQADCRQIMNVMHEKLPQELKEVIFQYLYLEDRPIPVGSYHFTTYVPEPLRSEHESGQTHSDPFIVVPEGSIRQDHSIEREQDIVYPDSWLLDPAFVGYPAACDASKFYYKSNTFSICTLENTMFDFFFRDPVHNFTLRQGMEDFVRPLGFTPIEYVRNVQIRIKYEHLTTYFSFYEELRNGEKDLLNGIFQTLRSLVDGIDKVTAAQCNVELLVMTAYLPSMDEDMRKRLHLNLLEAIRAPVYTLKHELGANLTVTHYDERFLLFPRNVTDNFQLTTEQWQYEKATLQALGRDHSPLHYYISSSASTTEPEGLGVEDIMPLAQFRWGFDDAVRIACKPITEGSYWPVRGGGAELVS